MLAAELQNLIAPISGAEPCGPDLDLAADAEYLNFIVGAESLLPIKSYFVKDKSSNERPFDPSSDGFREHFEAGSTLLARTRDLRLLVLFAKFFVLSRDLPGTITYIRAIATLLAERWDDVLPRAQDGTFDMRMLALESIDSVPTMVMPLQYASLFQSRRVGSISYRTYLLSTGEVKPREEETPLELSKLQDALTKEIDLPNLIEKRQQLVDLASALKQISQSWQDKSGSNQKLSLENLKLVTDKMITWLDATVSTRDPSAALVRLVTEEKLDADTTDDQGGLTATLRVGRIASADDASGALAAVSEYFSRLEPSSPALLLVRQASELLGKPFLEVMRVLVPAHVEKASINIGKDRFFGLPIESLASFSGPAGTARAQNNPPTLSGTFRVENRNEALALLDQVANFLRAAEPSSPIPFLLERARDFAQRDFLSVLQALLPADALKTSGKE
jgi:type VI secretion system protein ImpA